jgi:hypothetical protein
MSNPITAADGGASAVHLLNLAPGKVSSVALVGDANDFTWELQISTDGGGNYTAMTDANGDSSFTGASPKEFRPTSGALHRVEVTALGTATSVDVRTS